MRTWIKGSMLLVVALAGGAAIGASYERRRPRAESAPGMDKTTLMETLTRELSLDSPQREKVTAVLERRQSAIDSAWLTLRPRVRAALDSLQMEIVTVLRPDQRQRFLDLMRRAHPGARTMPSLP